MAAAELPGSADLPGTAAGHDAASTPEDHRGTAADNPDDSELWKPDTGETDGFWGPADDSPRNSVRSPGRHRSLASHQFRLRRSHTAAITLTLAAIAAGLGLIFSQLGTRHPPASDEQLHTPATGRTHPAPSPSTASPRPARTRHPARGTSHAYQPPATTPSPPPATSSPTPSSPSPKPTHQVTPGLISFENGTEGWTPFFGTISSSRTAQVAYSGSHALWVTAGSTYSAVGVDNGSIAHLQPGDKVTFHIYSDGQTGGSILAFAEQWSHPEDLVDNVALPTHPGWFTLTWVVPSLARIDAIGIQVVHHASGPLYLAIDALRWTGS
jgi:hypothetical protein